MEIVAVSYTYLAMSAMFAKQVTWWLRLLYIFITSKFWYLRLRKAATPKYLDQVNLTLKTFQWPWFHSYNTFGSKLVWSEYLVHLNHILTPTFEHFDTIRPRGEHPDLAGAPSPSPLMISKESLQKTFRYRRRLVPCKCWDDMIEPCEEWL